MSGSDMAKKPQKPKKQDKIEDEPGAEDRFRDITKRLLSTPPPKSKKNKRGEP